MPISETPNELAEMDVVDYGDGATCLHLQDTFARYSEISFTVGGKEKRGNPLIKRLAQYEQIGLVFPGRRISYWPTKIPDLWVRIFRDFATNRTSLGRRLFQDAFRVCDLLRGDLCILKTLR